MKWKIGLVLLAAFIVLSLPTLQALTVGFDTDGDGQKVKAVLGVIAETFINRTDFWDNLDTPADILLNDLGDVDAPTPAEGDVLIFDLGTLRWIPGSAGSVVGINGSLNNTNIAYTNVSNVFTENQFVNGNLNVSGNLTGNTIHAFMHRHVVAGETISVTAVNQWFNVSFDGGSPFFFNGFSVGPENLSIIVEKDGLYELGYTLSFAGSGSNEFEFGIVRNGVRIAGTGATRSVSVGGQFGVTSTLGLNNLNAGDEITLGVLDPVVPLRDLTWTHAKIVVESRGDIGVDVS